MRQQKRRFLILAAFAAIYFIWGSTFLAVRFAVASMPPFLMAGARFFIPGLLICALAYRPGMARPTTQQWGTAAIVGGCLLLLGSGSVAYAARYVPSSLVALLAATMPLFVTLLGWAARISPRPSLVGGVGLALGFAGVYMLVRPSPAPGALPQYGLGIALSLFSPLVWAIGSLYSKKHSTVSSPLLAVGMQLLCGGFCLLVLSLATGEFRQLGATPVSVRSFCAFLYLATFGSVVAFTAYSWLLQFCNPGLVATYAFVNPVVAVVLGAVWGGESIDTHMALGAALIVAAVVISVATNSGKAGRAAAHGGDG